MKWIMLLRTIVLCSLMCFTFRAVALAGNANPQLHLEIYMYSADPEDPPPPPPELCTHSHSITEIPCFSTKATYYYGLVPIHVNNLDYPLAQGWPPPCGPGGGYITVSCGIATTGVSLTFVGFSTCSGFVQGAGIPPQAIVVSATSACHGVSDHPGYCKYIASTNVGASYFNIVNNADDSAIKVINCQGNLDSGVAVGGGAQWGGTKTITCYYVPVEAGTWGKIKALFR